MSTACLKAVCETVQNRLILAIDRKLYERLTSFRVVPTIYVMKWARLLFIRDFPIDDIFVIWDFLLWEMHRGASLLRNIENIGAAMVYYNKAYLMNPKVRLESDVGVARYHDPSCKHPFSTRRTVPQ